MYSYWPTDALGESLIGIACVQIRALAVFLPFSCCERDERYKHFFHADTTVLKGVSVIRYIVIIVVGVGEKGIAGGQYIAGAEIG